MTCSTGKIVGASPQDAHQVIGAMKRRHKVKPQYAYRCQLCGAWHLTSRKERR